MDVGKAIPDPNAPPRVPTPVEHLVVLALVAGGTVLMAIATYLVAKKIMERMDA